MSSKDMQRPYTVAIVGAGIGREHLNSYLQLPEQYYVSTICELDAVRAQKLIELSPGIVHRSALDDVQMKQAIEYMLTK